MKKALFLLVLLSAVLCAAAEAPCAHESHSPDLGLCLTCGEPVFHAYVNGICACGRAPVFYDDLLPAEMYAPCEQKGTVEVIGYTAWNYPYRTAATEKSFAVWVPADYDPAVRYNVLVLMHGGGENFRAWMDETHSAGNRRFAMTDIYDNIAREGHVAPFIVASIPARGSEEQIAAELRYEILPAIAARYGTWAEGGTEADIQAARDHFGIGGLSDGSVYTFTTGMALCFDLFGNYMGLSGNARHHIVIERLRTAAYRDLPARCFYSACGTSDHLQASTYYSFQRMCEALPQFTAGENSWYMDQHGSHDWKVWSTGLYNALQVMF